MYHLHLAKVADPAIMFTFQPEGRGKMSYKNFQEFVHIVFVYILLIDWCLDIESHITTMLLSIRRFDLVFSR